MASLEGSAHDTNVASAVEGVVAATVSHFNELVLDGLAVKVEGVHEVSGAELVTPSLLVGVDIDHDDLASLARGSTLDYGETDTAGTEDGNVVALLDVGGNGGSTVTGGDTAAEQAGSVHGSIVLNGDDRDVGNDSVLGEGGSAHEVEQILALASESRGAIRHQTLALGGSDLATEVGLAGLAELALLAFWCAIGEARLVDATTERAMRGSLLESDDVVADLDVGDALTNGLNDTSTLVSEDDGKSTLGVLARQSVGI